MAQSLFLFMQMEFPWELGPPDGRYLLREHAAGDPDAVLVLRTLGAPERRLLKGRRGRAVEEAEPEPVPTSRATLIRPDVTAGVEEWRRGSHWLSGVWLSGDWHSGAEPRLRRVRCLRAGC